MSERRPNTAPKQRLQAWVPAGLKAEVDTLLEEEDMSYTELITQLLRERLKTRHQEQKEHLIIELNRAESLRLLQTMDDPAPASSGLKKLKAHSDDWMEQHIQPNQDSCTYDFRHLRTPEQKGTQS